ncbi:PaaI family thioesterase [uncultured Enterovirga sp.]|uniref:PaaI family thioesterase n=1 Tax=uncultured Enterovirga sp. TaxID=2026352 RepID=UPI0035CB28C1
MIFGADVPFAELCGIREVGSIDGRTRLRMEVTPELMNHLGMAHGGVLTTLLDVAMGTAARIASCRPVMTLDMQVSFLAPGRGMLLGHGHVSKAGRSILFCDAEVTREEDGELVARATGVFKTAREPVPAQNSV